MTILRFKFGVLFFLLFWTTFSFAQKKNLCGSDEFMMKMHELDPSLAHKQEQLEDFTYDFVNNKKSSRSTAKYIIPVVVHIFHDNGIGNIPDANVHDMLRIVNEDLQGNQPDTNALVDPFRSMVGGLDIELRLATKDPEGNCTNGINRINDPIYTYQGGYIDGDLSDPAPIAWPNNRYLNIWVVNLIDVNSQFLGYSAFPGTASQRDGIVIQTNVFGTLSPSSESNFSARYMSHEVGHFFNLCHIWCCNTGNGWSGNCNCDDNVSDTPNTLGTTDCNLSMSSCGSLDNVQNLMDYSYGSCTAGLMFTLGQADRMEAALNSPFGGRNNLWFPVNLQLTGTDDSSISNPPVCPPIADFIVPKQVSCTNESVLFQDISFNAVTDGTWTYNWSFPGGNPATSTEENPMVSYNEPGTYSATLTVTNSSGSSQPITKLNVIEIVPGSGSFYAPYHDEINSDWPDDSDPTLNYKVISPSGSASAFSLTTNAYYSSPNSIFLNNFSNSTNEDFEFITPFMDLSDMEASSTYLNFQVAHSKKSGETEYLLLYGSTDCGETWKLEEFITPSLLTSVPNPNSTAFVPVDTSEWKFLSFDMSDYAGESNVQFSFRFTSNFGNNLYIDDIAISDSPFPNTMTNIDNVFVNTFKLYPNPSSGVLNLDFYWDSDNEVKAHIVDIVGKKVEVDINSTINKGWNSIQLNTKDYNLGSGLYFLKLESDQKYLFEKFIIE